MSKQEFEAIGIDEDGEIVHHGGEVGKDAEVLASSDTSKEEKKEAGSDLSEHGHKYHPENQGS